MTVYFESIRISRHASMRIQQRLGLHKRAQKRLATNMWERGLRFSELSSLLKKWVLRQLSLSSPTGAEGIVYDNALFIVSLDGVVITVMQVPAALQQIAARCGRVASNGGIAAGPLVPDGRPSIAGLAFPKCISKESEA